MPHNAAIVGRTTPAYDDLAKRDAERNARMDELEKAVEEQRKERRALEDRADDQDDKIECLTRALDKERAEREKLQRRLDWFKVTVSDAEGWIRRVVEDVHTQRPDAWPLLLPLPSWIEDPGPP